MKVLINNGFIEEPVAATIGMFDGVHKGHRYILSHLKAQANKRNLKTAVKTKTKNNLRRKPIMVKTTQNKIKGIKKIDLNHKTAMPIIKTGKIIRRGSNKVIPIKSNKVRGSVPKIKMSHPAACLKINKETKKNPMSRRRRANNNTAKFPKTAAVYSELLSIKNI